MARGNQREQDRAKAQKKAAAQNKPKESGTSLLKRREADAEAMRQKNKLAAEKKEAEEKAKIEQAKEAAAAKK